MNVVVFKLELKLFIYLNDENFTRYATSIISIHR